MEETLITPISTPLTPAGNRTLFGILAYLGFLVIVPILVSKGDSFVKFHIKQGLILAVGEVAVWAFGMFAWNIMGGLWSPLSTLLNLVFLVLSIVGIVSVLQNQEKPLPYIGHLANKFDPYLK